MKTGDTVQLRQGRHKGHTVTLVAVNRSNATAYWACECGAEWHNAWDPEGNLGSEEAPEG